MRVLPTLSHLEVVLKPLLCPHLKTLTTCPNLICCCFPISFHSHGNGQFEHPDSLRSKVQWGVILVQKGDLNKARALYDAVARVHEQRLGPEHPETLRAKGNLANVLAQQKSLAGARVLYETVLDAQVPPHHG